MYGFHMYKSNTSKYLLGVHIAYPIKTNGNTKVFFKDLCINSGEYKMLSKLYLSNAKLVWNGNAVEGITEILKFIETLPSTETSVDTFDCHPLSDTFSQGQTTIAVVIFGSVKYHKQKARAFHQHFILTSQDNFCRIVSDDYRFLD